MKRHFLIDATTGAGVDELMDGINEYKRWLIACSRDLVNRLCIKGHSIAAVRFASAVYDGTNDVTVSVEDRGGGMAKAIVALGGAALFIEFGTGVVYPDTHPEAAMNGMIRGGYGSHKGLKQKWTYYGDPGSNGQVTKSGKVITSGNPANMPMYQTVKDLERELRGLVAEVFAK